MVLGRISQYLETLWCQGLKQSECAFTPYSFSTPLQALPLLPSNFSSSSGSFGGSFHRCDNIPFCFSISSYTFIQCPADLLTGGDPPQPALTWSLRSPAVEVSEGLPLVALSIEMLSGLEARGTGSPSFSTASSETSLACWCSTFVLISLVCPCGLA